MESKLNQYILQQQSPLRKTTEHFVPLKTPYNIKSESNLDSTKKNNLSLLNCSLSKNIYQKEKCSGFDLSGNSNVNEQEKRFSNFKNEEKGSKIKNIFLNDASRKNSGRVTSENDEKPHILIGQSSRNLYHNATSDRNFKLKPSSSFGDSNIILENPGLYQVSIENINEISIGQVNTLGKSSFDIKEVNIYNKEYEKNKETYKNQFRVRDVDELSAESNQDMKDGLYEVNKDLNVSGHINQIAELQYGSRNRKSSQSELPVESENTKPNAINISSNQEYLMAEDSKNSLGVNHENEIQKNLKDKTKQFETPNGKIVTVNPSPAQQEKKYIPLAKKLKLKNSLKEKLKNKLNSKKKSLVFTPKENAKTKNMIGTPGNFSNSVPVMPNMMMNPIGGTFYGNNFQNIPNNRAPTPFNLPYFGQHFGSIAPVNPVAPIKNNSDGNIKFVLVMTK